MRRKSNVRQNKVRYIEVRRQDTKKKKCSAFPASKEGHETIQPWIIFYDVSDYT